MIERKANELIHDFFKNDKRSLLVTGARQVGKTFAIRKIGKECFDQVVEINFIEQPDAIALFSEPKDANGLLLRLSAFTRKQLIPGKTLIFFDEVQECKEIVTAIKFLVDEGSYRYVMSGSLLGVELKDIRSVPVGYMGEIEMFPLDLQEFATTVGISSDVQSHLRECFEQQKPVDSFIHERMLELVRLYLIVGGMPAAVQRYLDTNNLRRVLGEQRDIIRTYKRDITKYDPKRKLLIEEIYDLIPSELNAKNKRFILKSLNEGAKFKQYAESFLWLKNAGVAIPVYNVEEPVFPLKLNKQRNLFKLFQNDVGLLAYQYSDGIQLRILSGGINLNYGAVYENFVAQELYAHGYKDKLYYFNSKKQGEVDFVLESTEGTILPTEVKSGKDYEFHLALNNILGNEQYGIPEAITLCNDNISIRGKVVNLPVYMTLFLKRKQEVTAGEFVPDISALT